MCLGFEVTLTIFLSGSTGCSGGYFSRDQYNPGPPSSPLSAPLAPTPEIRLSSQKRTRVKEHPQEKGFSYRRYRTIPVIPSLVMTPKFNLKTSISNMCKTVHRSDVDSLAGHPMEGERPLIGDANDRNGLLKEFFLSVIFLGLEEGLIAACAEQFKNLSNLRLDFDFGFLDMRVDEFGRIGGVGDGGPSRRS
ncbi:hypothetical protein Salat_2523300 [Sesamum alatum]|uniref:Uncharacterized protein n=1 Tax=Sesamum alatum TaxID=300844 RepID=A0AAE1XS02_9LAMI|nr:hypothetical protein Salat_2523300 [Sesamum alatum]